MGRSHESTPWIEDTSSEQGDRESPGATRDALFALTLGWIAAAAAAFALVDGGTRFLGMPLGAYLAGQGLFMALVLVSVRIAQGRGGQSRSRSAATSGPSAGGIG